MFIFPQTSKKMSPKCLLDHIWSRCDSDLWPFDLKI